MSPTSNLDTLALTAQIVAAHVRRNQVPTDALTALIHAVHAALAGAAEPAVGEPARPEPAVPVKRSVFPDHIICLEDGKKLKMLKRHLLSAYNMTPDQYRQRWGLPSDYPMVAPNYAEKRSALARSIGLGRKVNGGKAAPAEPAVQQVPEGRSGTRKKKQDAASQ